MMCCARCIVITDECQEWSPVWLMTLVLMFSILMKCKLCRKPEWSLNFTQCLAADGLRISVEKPVFYAAQLVLLSSWPLN